MRTERYDTERSGEERLPAPGFPDATGDLPASDGDAVTGEDGEEAGLYEHFAVTADKGQTPLRLDKFLTVRMEHCSRNRIQAAADSGNILVNGKPAKSSYKVKPLDRIRIVMPYPRRETELRPEPMPLDIPYEDDDLLIVNKPAGLVVPRGCWSSPRTSRRTPGWPNSSSTTRSSAATWPSCGATSNRTREPSRATSDAAPASGRKCTSSPTDRTASTP